MIKIDDTIRKKWHSGFDRQENPSEIIIHGTGGGGTFNFVFNGGRKELYIKGIALFHFLIERTGEIIEIINPEKWVYHSSCGEHDSKTIGIELVNPSANNTYAYMPIQYDGLFEIFDELFTRYNISIIRSHNKTGLKYSGKGKLCPGNAFAWSKIGQWLVDNGYMFEDGEEEFTGIIKRPEEKTEEVNVEKID